MSSNAEVNKGRHLPVKEDVFELGYPLLELAPVTQDFGANEKVYQRFGLKGHNGLDLGAYEGMPVLAMADGVVRYSGDGAAESLMGSAAGNCILLTHNGYPEAPGFMTGYAHLSRIYARPGDQVRRGDCIGLVGKTGATTGAHLHAEYMPAPLDLDNGYVGRAAFSEYLVLHDQGYKTGDGNE
jgi:murein DD-endopeptidase MepM/ murein hydrolase activator NlpD